jgi:hypothetical protein
VIPRAAANGCFSAPAVAAFAKTCMTDGYSRLFGIVRKDSPPDREVVLYRLNRIELSGAEDCFGLRRDSCALHLTIAAVLPFQCDWNQLKFVHGTGGAGFRPNRHLDRACSTAGSNAMSPRDTFVSSDRAGHDAVACAPRLVMQKRGRYRCPGLQVLRGNSCSCATNFWHGHAG